MPKKPDIKQEVLEHNQDAKNILEVQIPAFNKGIDLYRGHIDTSKWPYRSRVFDPRIYTVISNKTSRLFAQPPRGKVHPREGSDVASAKVVNELLNFQWDVASHFNGTMLEKYMLMDTWARIYGSSFALVKWHRTYDKSGEVIFDGPELQVLRNVDCLPDPRATCIADANWFQVVEYTTLNDLENTSDTKGKPVYKNLGELRKMLREGVDQHRGEQFRSRNLELWGIDDTSQGDVAFARLKIVTEYRRDRWITFCPNFTGKDPEGVIIREIDNPYDHGQIPIIMLRYYPLGDTLYGSSEIEPVASIQRAINAAVNQRFDLANMILYPPTHINPNEVRMHTLEWGPAKFWHMERPNQSVQSMVIPDGSLPAFESAYSLMVASLNNAVGEQSVGTSNLGVFNPEKTATEIADVAAIRNARDVNNANFLAETIKRQMMMWINMDKQFLETPYIVRIVGKQTIARLRDSKFADYGISEEQPEMPEPRFNEVVKNELAEVRVFDEDFGGMFDYIPDVESMALPNRQEITELRRAALEFMLNPMIQAQMAERGIVPDIIELIGDLLEDSGLKDARKYFQSGGTPEPTEEGEEEVAGPPTEGMVAEGGPPAGPPTGEVAEAPPSPEEIPMQGRGVLQKLLSLIGR